MKNLKLLKTLIIFFFFIIVYHGDKISLFNGLILILNVLDKVTGVFDINPNYFGQFINLVIYVVTLLSCITIFKEKKQWLFCSLIIQLSYLIYTFNIEYLNYWYYYVPTSIYLVLSLFLIIKLWVKKDNDNFKRI
jgi:hypothetical protein